MLEKNLTSTRTDSQKGLENFKSFPNYINNRRFFKYTEQQIELLISGTDSIYFTQDLTVREKRPPGLVLSDLALLCTGLWGRGFP